MNPTILKPGDEAWREVLQQARHDFYHLPGYAALSSKYDRGEGEALLVRDGVSSFFLPYIIRDLSKVASLGSAGRGLKDITSAYGYPGPLIMTGDPEFYQSAVRAFCAAMRERSVVSGFIRLHPLFPMPDDAAPPGRIVPRGKTVSIDLTLDPDEIRRQTRADHRRNISKAKRLGFTVSMDRDLDDLDTFLEIYVETMDRVGADTYYYFPREYYLELKEALGGGLWLCSVADPEGRIVTSGLFTEICGIVQFHLSGTRTDALQQRPSKLMIDSVRTWAKERGNDVMHLGGGYGGKEDALFRFKAGFSPRMHDFATWHLIFMEDAYRDLMCASEEQTGSAADAQFFPAYRAAS